MIEETQNDKVVESPLVGDPTLDINNNYIENTEKSDDKSEKSGLSKKTLANIDKLEKQLNNTKPKKEKHIEIRKDASELIVITKARDLVKYVINATRKIPKSERYSFAVKIQNLALDMIECMVRANNIVIVPKKPDRYRRRYEFQEQAMGDLKVLEYLVAIAVEENLMLLKQFAQISKLGTEVFILLNKWCESDKRRFLAMVSKI